MKKDIFLILTFILCGVSPICVSAHQPNYVGKNSTVFDSEPTISKAYYGELANQPTIYAIYSNSTFDMYVNILSPDIQNASKDYTIIIKDSNNNVIKTISSSSSEWTRWYEDFGGDWYWKGPAFKKQFSAGTYNIIVSNPDNIGKYSLAIGELESFPINTFIHTIKELFFIKTKFFNEPWYGIFYGIIGKYLLFSSLILVIILIFVIRLILRLLRSVR